MNRFHTAIIGIAAISIWGFSAPQLLKAQSKCDYFASPNGGGDGLSSSHPFKISNFWPLASPGTSLCLLDGTYTDSGSMIAPPAGLSGISGNPITVRALNDGAALIDGLSLYIPIRLQASDYWIIEGINAANSRADVVAIYGGSDHNIIRRVVAWDARVDENTSVWDVWNSNYNLLEDVAGFGTGRKAFQIYDSSNNTIRRAWGMYNTYSGENNPNGTYSLTYQSFNIICENCIGTYNQDVGFSPPNPIGIFVISRLNYYPAPWCSKSKFLGSIAYTLNNDNYNALGHLVSTAGHVEGDPDKDANLDCMTADNFVSYMGGSHPYQYVMDLNNPYNNNNNPAPTSLLYSHGTEVSSDGLVTLGDKWIVTNRASGTTIEGVPNIWNGAGTKGARVCYRYVDGALTSSPLWPWPMNQRIINALIAAHRTPVNVTATMEQIFGTIPNQCKQTLTDTFVPTNLGITHVIP
jgi:hypothetical protein